MNKYKGKYYLQYGAPGTEYNVYANSRFGDFPHRLPTKKWTSKDELFTGWMLLSYKKPCTASTERNEFKAANLTDENIRSFWVAGTNTAGQWATIDLQKEYEVKSFQLNYTDYQSDISRRAKLIEVVFVVTG